MADENKFEAEEEFVSKTQRKKQMDALQSLGRELIDLPADRLTRMGLPDALLGAIAEYKRINSHSAKKRQEQYIGRLMRDIDPEPIQAQLAACRGESARHTAWLHRIERWREQLIADDKMLPAFLAEHPGTDVQALRTLIRNVRKEQQEARPPKFFRQLFQQIKDIIPEPQPVPAATPDSEDEQ